MTVPQTEEPSPRKPLRLWPGVVAVALQWLLWLIVPAFVPGTGMIAALGGLAGGIIVLLWWLFFSRAPWIERLGAVVLMIGVAFVTSRVIHKSIAGGMMGLMFIMYIIPALSLALVIWAVATRRFPAAARRVALIAAVVITCGVFTLLRTDGIEGDGGSDLNWRWAPTAEERLLAQANAEPPKRQTPITVAEASEESATAPAAKPAVQPAAEPVAEWPGFRGRDRDAVIRNVRIQTDWEKSPPVELWRRAIGPGWSSFAVNGDLLYTQEQRGDDELVGCYRVSTGEPVWRHNDPVRFWESNGGAGPRGTPTLNRGRVYAFGATGILNALDAATGKVVWSRNVATDSETKVPGWGFSSSPLVINDVVIVAATGKLAAYDVTDGKLRWFGPARGGSYSSPHRVTISGEDQVLLLSNSGVISVAPANGTVLWEYEWRGSSIIQPTVLSDGDILISTGGPTGGLGTRRLAIAPGTGGWTITERGKSTGLKPYFNDLIVHKNHAYGFDGSILACIDLEQGQRKWKGGRYGYGQLILLAEQDLLLVLSEQGDLALVAATPDDYKELARFPAIKGKTWNHPALVKNVLLIRNGEEMAAFRLPLIGG